MNYNVATIPKDLPVTTDSTDFNPEEMRRMFDSGAEWARTNRMWRHTPPGYELGEGVKFRGGTMLTDLSPRPPAAMTECGPRIRR